MRGNRSRSMTKTDSSASVNCHQSPPWYRSESTAALLSMSVGFGFKLVFQGPGLRAVGHGGDALHHVEQSCQGDSHSTVWCGAALLSVKSFRHRSPYSGL